MADLLDELLTAVGLNNQKLVESSTAVKELLAKQQQAAEQQQAALDKSGAADQIIIQANGIADQKAQAQTQKFATDLGANPDSSTEIMSTIAKDWKASALNAIDKSKKLESDLAIKFFEHPVDYVVAQLRMEDTVKEADAAIAHRNSSSQALAQAHALTQSAAAASSALKSTVTDATLQASLDKASADIEAKKASLAIQNAGIQIGGIESVMRMDTAQLNNLSTAFSAKKQNEQLDISRQHLEMSREQFNLQKQEWEEKLKERNMNREEMENLADVVRTGAASLGFPDVKVMPTNKIVQMLNMKADGFQDYLNAGMKTQALGHPVVSESAGEAARMITERGAPMRPEQANIKTFMTNMWNKAASPEGARTGQYDNTKKDQVTRAAGTFAVQAAKQMHDNIDPKDGSNIYAAPPLPAVMALPGIKSTEWYKKVMAPQMSTGELKEFNPEQLAGFTVKAVQDKVISFNDAVTGLQAAHSGAARINNATKNYVGLGLPPQVGFKTQMKTQLGFTRQYDLATPQDVTNLLSMKLVKAYTPNVNNPFSLN